MGTLRVYDHEGKIRHPSNSTAEESRFSNRFFAKQRVYLDTTGSNARLECYLHATPDSYDEHLFVDWESQGRRLRFSEVGEKVFEELSDDRGWSITTNGKREQRICDLLRSVSGGQSYGLEEEVDTLLNRDEHVTAAVSNYRVALSFLAYFADRGITAIVADEETSLEDADVRLYRDSSLGTSVKLTSETQRALETARRDMARDEIVSGIETLKNMYGPETVKNALNEDVFDVTQIDYEVVELTSEPEAGPGKSGGEGGSLARAGTFTLLPLFVGFVLSYVGLSLLIPNRVTDVLGRIMAFDLSAVFAQYLISALVSLVVLLACLTGYGLIGLLVSRSDESLQRSLGYTLVCGEALVGLLSGFTLIATRGPLRSISVMGAAYAAIPLTVIGLIGAFMWAQSNPAPPSGLLRSIDYLIVSPISVLGWLSGSSNQQLDLESPSPDVTYHGGEVKITGDTSADKVSAHLFGPTGDDRFNLPVKNGRFYQTIELPSGEYTLEIGTGDVSREVSFTIADNVTPGTNALNNGSSGGKLTSSDRTKSSRSTSEDVFSSSGRAERTESTERPGTSDRTSSGTSRTSGASGSSSSSQSSERSGSTESAAEDKQSRTSSSSEDDDMEWWSAND